MTKIASRKGGLGVFTQNWHIRIASILPNWTDIRNNCRYEQVIRNRFQIGLKGNTL